MVIGMQEFLVKSEALCGRFLEEVHQLNKG
jgi:hypothetical protein